jgi:DNA polymerase III subunit alpha
VGTRQMYDLEVRHRSHNFVLASGIVTSNSHAVTYGAITTVELWLKYNYPIQFMTALINNTKQGKKKLGSNNLMVDYINFARRCGVPVLPPDVNRSKKSFTIEGKSIRYSLGHVKNISKGAEYIEMYQPYANMQDFYDRVKIGVVEEVEEIEEDEELPTDGVVVKKKKPSLRRPTCRVVDNLIAAGAFDCFGDKNAMMTEYYKLRKEKELPNDKTEDQWIKLEAEALGLSLSKPILYKKYDAEIQKHGLHLINDVVGNVKKRVVVFGEIINIRQHVSRVGNSMHIVTISDGIDTMTFFVFQGGWETFKYNYKGEGTIGAIPLSKFDEGDSDTRFFDDRGKFLTFK